MELRVVVWIFSCFLLPTVLLAASLIRYNVLSLVYFLYVLLLPWFLCPNKHSVAGPTAGFVQAVLCTSGLFLLAHACFQTVLFTYSPLTVAIGDNCSKWDTISRHVGLSRLPLDDLWSVLRLLCPDLVVCVVALVTVFLWCRLVRNREMVAAALITSLEDDLSEDEEDEEYEDEEDNVEDAVNEEGRASPDPDASMVTKAKQPNVRNLVQKVLRDLERMLAVILLALAGITLPCAFSGIYFLLFIGMCTWWACHLPISHLGFNALCVLVGFFSAGHMLCLYLYQTLLAQALFPPHSLWARLFGLKDIIIPGNCSAPHQLHLNDQHDWPVYVNPAILLLLYLTMVTVLRTGRQATSHQVREKLCDTGDDQVELRALNRPHNEDDTQFTLLSVGTGNSRAPTDPRDPEANPDGASSQQSESPFFLLRRVVMQQSYVCALIAMMVWSITYHSWLTFVLLLWACIIWIVRARRHAASLCSPFLLLYALVLVCIQYIWALELQPELPAAVGTMSLRQLGLVRAQYPCLRLGALLLFTLTFWLLLHQSVKENFSHGGISAPLQEVTTAEAANESIVKFLGNMVMSCYAKYWIYVCGGMFIMVSFAGKLVGYKIVYMLLFLLCLCVYQVCYSLWRRLLKLFWWLVVAYTMLVLISIYTFQFEDFPQYWRNFTGFTEQQLAAIGLETFALSELFSSILIPGFFLLACMLQLHYFHTPFMRITDLEHIPPVHRSGQDRKASEDEKELETGDTSAETGSIPLRPPEELLPSKWGLVMDRLLDLSRRFSNVLTKGQVFLWRLLELHAVKMVAFFSVWVALNEPSVINLLLVVLWATALPYRRFRPMASTLSTLWVSVIITCKMLYQLSVVNPQEYSSICSLPLQNETNLLPLERNLSSLYKRTIDPAEWFGIRKEDTVLGYSKNHLLVLMLLVFEATVYRHQTHHYRHKRRPPPVVPVLFPDATREALDGGVGPCVMYLLNFFFYKFGLEVCFLMTVNVIGQRMNFMVIFHGCWLVAILVRRRRAAIARLWPRYCLFLSIFMIFQYILCVGLPPALCTDYLWRRNTPVLINSALIKWLYLPDFYTAPDARNLIVDFILLMCASQQWQVFVCEQTKDWREKAGENTDHPEPMKGQLFNPTPNFINCRSYLDMLKVLVFRQLFWLVLAVVFMTGASRVSVFGLGYLISCFFFLLSGHQLLMKPSSSRLLLWDCLIIYNVSVIISKNLLSILACVFVVEMQKSFCWVIQLFSLVCTVNGYYDPSSVGLRTCSLPVAEAGIIWDGICFFFLLLQRRVFLSFYFLHVTTELKAAAKQATRGYELFRANMMKNIRIHQEAEKKSLSQLKKSMKRIYLKQNRYRLEHKTKKADKTAETSSSKKRTCYHPWLDHASVLHSGDYYLFESDSEGEETQAEEQWLKKQTAYQLAYESWVRGLRAALRDRQRRQKHTEMLKRKDTVAAQSTGSDEYDVLDSLSQTEEEEIISSHGEMVQRILDILQFLWSILVAVVDGLTDWLDVLTRQYRETSAVLTNERYFIVRKMQQHQAARTLTAESSHDSETFEMCLDETENTNSLLEVDHGAVTGCSTPKLGLDSIAVALMGQPPSGQRHSTASELLGDGWLRIEELDQSRAFFQNQNRLLKLLFALYHLLAANSELVCYFVIVLNNVVSASVLSLVLPMMVFLWAMLSVPRPSKRFWIGAIIYTVVMVVVKYLCQFGFLPWNSVYEMRLNEDKPFFPPRILGVEKTENYIKYDLLQLLALFFHRLLLMRYGLWDHNDPLLEPCVPAEISTKEKKLHDEGKDGRRKDRGGAEVEAVRGNSPVTLENIQLQDQSEDTKDIGGPSTCPAPVPQKDTLNQPNDKMDREDVPKKSSSIRFRRKSKKLKDQSKGGSSESPGGSAESPGGSADSPAGSAESPGGSAESPGVSAEESVKKKKKGKRTRKEVAGQKLVAVGHKLQHVITSGVHSVSRPAQSFLRDITHADCRAATDVYALMFLTDVIDFIIIMFGFWAFGKHSAAADIASSLSEDQVPEAFLVMLLIQFSTMIIDRALYLRKAVMGKLIFQVIMVVGIHLWMFFILPAVTERMFNQNSVAQLWYFMKCVYFGLSAYQIRCGYPTRILGNFLTKNFNHLNLFLFQGFRLVPFLVELRAVMDWVWTDTTLSLSNWMCVEDIYANIFIIKCSRETEKKYPQPKGQRKKKIVKYGMGGLIIIFLICIIWFPLLFISLVRSVVGVVNHPIDVTVMVKLGGYEPLFTMSVQQQSIQPFTEAEYEELTRTYGDDAVAMQFITLYGFEDLVTAMIEGSSGSVWRISPPSRQEVIRELLESPADLTLRLAWNFQRDLGRGGTVEHSSDRHSIQLEPGNPVRAELARLLLGNRTEPVLVPKMFPKFIRAPNGADAKPVSQLLKGQRSPSPRRRAAGGF